MTHANHERVIAAWAEAWNRGNVAALDAIMAPDYVRHDGSGPPVTLAEHKDRIVTLREAFPDLLSVVDDIFSTSHRIAIRWTTTGTQEGVFHGLPPTGRSITVSGNSIGRLVGDRIVEEWVTWDPSQMLAALGVVSLAAR